MIASKRLLYFLNIIVFAGLLFLLFWTHYNFYKIYDFTKEHLQNGGFKIEEIHINDLEFIDVREIVDVLDFSYGDSIFDVDLKKNQLNIESNFWVNAAALKKVFPNIIEITISEKTPKFVWFHDDEYKVVNAKGNVIKKVDKDGLDEFAGFVSIIGDEADNFVPNLLEFIDLDEEIYSYISIVTLVNKRRWDVKFVNDMVVQLPSEGVVDSWQKFIELNKKLNFFNNKIKNIDLRVKDRVFIELDLNNPGNRKILRQIG